MMNRSRIALVFLLFPGAMALGGCVGGAGSAGEVTPTPAPAPATEGAAPRDPARLAELEQLYWSQMAASRTRFHEADVRFMQGMIPHHAQALLMVGLVPERAGSPGVRTLSERIRNTQADEIALMEQWLRGREQAVPEWAIHGTHLMLGEEHDHHAMPGMLTEAQVAGLAAAEGAEFDRLFLSFMIQHHRGALEMVRTLLTTDGAGQDPEVFRFASDVQVDQTTEIARMERMLRDLSPGAP
jgi:uncharacterized protein (DUF305 family)